MAGQSPIVINAGVSYSDFENGLDAQLFYNVKGSTLYIVGAGLFPDIYYEPFHSLNFTVNKKLGEKGNTTIDLKVSNILNDTMKIQYKAYKAENQPFTTYSPGMAFSLGVSHNF